MKLSDRMLRADVFTDGRLIRVSPGARLLAMVLDPVAEATGVVRRDPDEIRSSAALFLADEEGMPPAAEQIETWVEELVARGWALAYEAGSMRLLYLRGFGTRQKGANVCIGVSQTTGEIEPHLPTPPCVTLVPHHEKTRDKAGHEVDLRLRKMLPRHCQEAGICPCERFTNPSPTHPEQVSRGNGIELDLRALEIQPDEDVEGHLSEGEREGELDAEFARLSAEFGPEIAAQALFKEQLTSRKCDPPRAVSAAMVRVRCEALVQRDIETRAHGEGFG
jgi:hypothetical protein